MELLSLMLTDCLYIVQDFIFCLKWWLNVARRVNGWMGEKVLSTVLGGCSRVPSPASSAGHPNSLYKVQDETQEGLVYPHNTTTGC